MKNLLYIKGALGRKRSKRRLKTIRSYNMTDPRDICSRVDIFV